VRTPITVLALLFAAAAAGLAAEKQTNRYPKTPSGLYQKEITNRIGRLWYALTEKEMDSLSTGTVRLNFRVSSNGVVRNIKIVSNSASDDFGELCVRAVMEAKLPPMPDAVRRQIGQDWLEVDNVRFTLYFH
jgi:TonB family protein